MLRMLVAEPRRHHHLDCVAEQLGALVAEELLGLRVDQRDTAVRAYNHHRVRRRFEQRAELVLATLADGEITDSGGDDRAARGLDRIQTYFDWKFGAVFSQTMELEAGSHRASCGVGEVRCAILHMPVAETLRQQHLDLVAKHLGARVSEELLGLGVDHQDATVVAHNHHRVRGRLEHRTVALGDLQSCFRGDEIRTHIFPHHRGPPIQCR